MKVYERCDRCGERAAMRIGDYIRESHDCEFAPPGPSNPPRTHYPDAVELVAGNWTADELLYQLKQACEELEEVSAQALEYRTVVRQIERIVAKGG